MPVTGDQTAATVATVGGLGAIIAAIGAFFHRRNKAE
ncbi:LPXTG cell wall anchor domain-containing protein [Collinsella aerofaciens]